MKVFLITSTRADFGLLKNLIINLKKDKFLDLKYLQLELTFQKNMVLVIKKLKKKIF